jgi:hypothetical protein
MAFCKHEASKRKSESEVGFRAFNEEWEEQFLFTMRKSSKPICLICNLTVPVPKKYNTERHFKQNHDTHLTHHTLMALRSEYILKNCQRNLFVKKCEEMKDMLRASYEISFYLLARRKMSQTVRLLKKASLFLSNTLVMQTQGKWWTIFLFLEIQS